MKKILFVFSAAILFLASFPVFGQEAQKAAGIEERLGPDDGAALAILFGANMRGNLDLCDCTYPRGGLARRIGYVESFKRRFKDTPVIHVEAGFFLYDSSVASPAVILQNEQVARAYSRWPIDVINLGRFDLVFAQRLLSRQGYDDRAASLPMIRNLISANGVFGKDVIAPPPYIIREVSGPRIKGPRNMIRVGFVGIAEPIRPAEGRDGMVRDMYESARAVVAGLRKECDLLVIVAHCEMNAAVRLAEENPQADVVIAGNAEGIFKPRKVGGTLVVSAAPGNTQQGDLRVYVSGEGRLSFKFAAVDLDASIPADPEAEAFVESARLERLRK